MWPLHGRRMGPRALPHQATPMNTLLRKHSTGLLTIAIYAAIITFSLLVSFGVI
jgi:hypothetical protein